MLYNKKKGFASLVGREEIKDKLASQIYVFCRNPKIFFNNFQNFVIYGKSGVGKTKLTETMAYIYCKSGILIREKYRCVTTQDFKSPYVNESAKLTREIFLSTLEGVLLVDEAYAWIPEGKGLFKMADHGEESLTEAVNFWDKNIGLSITCLAGYKDKLQVVLDANEGIDRPSPDKITLEDYTSEQLTHMLIQVLFTKLIRKLN